MTKTQNAPSFGNLVAYFDGACEPRNPGGNMGIGASIRQGRQELFQYKHFVPEGPRNSNNVAEYMAFLAILEFIYANGWKNLTMTIFGDSKLVINQMFSNWKMNGGFYVPYAKQAKDMLARVRERGNKINGIWIRREQNGYADELSKAELINHNVQFRIQPLHLNAAQ